MKDWYKKLIVVLPAYNESQNIKILLDGIFAVSKNIHVLIVDDSVAGEKRKIKKIIDQFKNVEYITREKKSGRGSAVLLGFATALKNTKYDYFIEMDTDLAHFPSEIPVLYKGMQKTKAHLVIGSRYLTKSHIVQWPAKRLFLSKLINAFLNMWLGLNLHDYTNGFRLYTRAAVADLVRLGLRESNFIALSESAYKLKKNGYTLTEVPITFTDRKHGTSTVGRRELVACLISALRIRFQK